jgi:hypothetical protein
VQQQITTTVRGPAWPADDEEPPEVMLLAGRHPTSGEFMFDRHTPISSFGSKRIVEGCKACLVVNCDI